MIGNGAAQINWCQFSNTFVPDFDYYKQNHPEKFQQYMNWIEQNMTNKDKFLEGIDQQFETLIAPEQPLPGTERYPEAPQTTDPALQPPSY